MGDDKYKAFFHKVWDAYCNHEIELEAGEDIVQIALKLGLAVEEPYDPDTHGEALGDEWGLETGDACYVLAKVA